MRSVLPPRDQGVAWWASHQGAGTSQSSARQRGWRRARALRWAGVNSRAVRPRSSTSLRVPRTAGTSPAVQASRRAWPAVMVSPVPSCAVPSPVCNVSSGMVRIIVVARPPWSGSRRGSRRSSRAQNARPRCRSAGMPDAGRRVRRGVDTRLLLTVAWGGERLQVGLQPGGDGVGHGGGDVRGPVAATCEVQPGQRRRPSARPAPPSGVPGPRRPRVRPGRGPAGRAGPGRRARTGRRPRPAAARPAG